MPHADGVRSSWTRIVRWLEEHAPASAQALNPPATDADIQRLSDHLRFRLPQALETWLRQNNGSTAKDSTTAVPGGFRLVPHVDSRIFPGGEVFLDCQSIINHHGNDQCPGAGVPRDRLPEEVRLVAGRIAGRRGRHAGTRPWRRCAHAWMSPVRPRRAGGLGLTSIFRDGSSVRLASDFGLLGRLRAGLRAWRGSVRRRCRV